MGSMRLSVIGIGTGIMYRHPLNASTIESIAGMKNHLFIKISPLQKF
jgi:hypothetical protein